MTYIDTDESVVPAYFQTASVERQAADLAAALVSILCVRMPDPGTFGYQWLHMAKFLLEQQRLRESQGFFEQPTEEMEVIT